MAQGFLTMLREYIRLTEADEILRRYFLINSFDGAMATLGVMSGLRISGSSDMWTVLITCINSSVAMGISGFAGTFLVEKAERERELTDMERELFMDLDDSILGKASRAVTVLSAIIDSLSPLISSMIILLPYMTAPLLGFPAELCFPVSFILAAVLLFILGYYLGKISNRGKIMQYALITTSAGLLVGLMSILWSGMS